MTKNLALRISGILAICTAIYHAIDGWRGSATCGGKFDGSAGAELDCWSFRRDVWLSCFWDVGANWWATKHRRDCVGGCGHLGIGWAARNARNRVSNNGGGTMNIVGACSRHSNFGGECYFTG